MFFSRTTVIVAFVLVLFAQPALAQPTQSRGVAWLEPVHQLWSAVTFYWDVFADDSGVDGTPEAAAEATLGWIDPSGVRGEAPTAEAKDGDSDPSPSRNH
ncbi:MAG: hypothetical protein AAFY88_17690, partial [Acidobacteriota bacterium]